jgi:hypothetical protein
VRSFWRGSLEIVIEGTSYPATSHAHGFNHFNGEIIPLCNFIFLSYLNSMGISAMH